MQIRPGLAAVALGLAACSSPPASAPATSAPAADPVAAEDFLAAYERSRLATFVVEQTFVRSRDGEAALVYGTRIVQRPPDDRLTVGGGNAEGKLDGQVVRCSTEPSGTSSCLDGGPAPDDAGVIAGEVDDLRRLVAGDHPAYGVAVDGDGCFVLTLGFVYPSPPYGVGATFCFDAGTGAPTRVVVDHGGGIVDETTTDEVRADVGPADLRVGELGALPAPDLPTTTTTAG